MASSSSGSGFQHGYVYKITSVKDKNCVEIADSSVQPGAKVIIQKSKNASHQKFKTEQIEDVPGGFRVSAVMQPSDGTQLVWDFLPGEIPGLVIHNTASGSPNQIWSTEKVYDGNPGILYIKTQDGLCLKNMGKKKQLALVPKNARDSYQHWRLAPTTSY